MTDILKCYRLQHTQTGLGMTCNLYSISTPQRRPTRKQQQQQKTKIQNKTKQKQKQKRNSAELPFQQSEAQSQKLEGGREREFHFILHPIHHKFDIF